MRHALAAWLSRDDVGLQIAVLTALASVLVMTVQPIAGRLLLILAVPLLAGGLLQLWRLRRSLAAHPPPGRLVDVGGYRIHVLAEGEGGPPVVWIPGSHDQGLAMHPLHRRWRSHGRSILFDRASSGCSDTGPFPRSLPREVVELRAALAGAGEQGPFVLVAHSFGGLLAQAFAEQHPDQVAGLVLLDSACPDAAVYTRDLPANRIPGAGLGRWAVTAFGLAWIVIARMRGAQREWLDQHDAATQPLIVQAICRPRLVIGFRSALRAAFKPPFDLVKGRGALGELPLLAIIPPVPEAEQLAEARQLLPDFSEEQRRHFVRMRIDAQRQTADLSRRGELRYAPEGTTHGFPLEVPDFTVDTVRGFIDGLRERPVPAAVNQSLQQRLERCIAAHDVPGAAIAVWREGALEEAAAGVLSRVSGAPVTHDALFHIGSVSKLFTASLTMQLVEQGRIDLDAPLIETVPEFRLAGTKVTNAITTRHLLCHASGIPGDFFHDTGSGEDKLQRYTVACADLTPVFPAGQRFSYCNAGYGLLGRQIELITGQSFEQALAERLMQPLGIRHWACRPEDELKFRSAVGHVPAADGGWEIAPPAPAALVPAGSRLAMSAAELLRFARLILNQSRAEDGRGVLDPATIASMLTPQLEVPSSSRIDAWGLGWMLFDYGGRRVVGHDGGTAGMTAQLRVVPDADVALAVFSNGGDGGAVFRELGGAILAECGAPLPEPLQDRADVPVEFDQLIGTYRRYGMEVRIEAADGALSALVSARDGEANVPAPTRFALSPVDGRRFLIRMPGAPAPSEILFDGFEDDRAQFLYAQERALRRVGD